MPESLNTGKVYEKGKDYFSFYIDCCWLSSGRMSGKLYPGCSGRNGVCPVNEKTTWGGGLIEG
ncbi:hypothetical protein GCM10010136_34960 [Limoniibacter endophyticus]|uniref:Uncharacterized protein n=1 Tax=Limoniibacter endophyticus TaxID=1565040 RepID=A0A8J3GJ19_9HYPH|nr:hypothetical protein GCM10010136_34960 [Limoniibacter endophyticus]